MTEPVRIRRSLAQSATDLHLALRVSGLSSKRFAAEIARVDDRNFRRYLAGTHPTPDKVMERVEAYLAARRVLGVGFVGL